MIVDASALVAIVTDEPDADRYIAAMRDAEFVGMSCAGYLETAIVIDKAKQPSAGRRLDELIVEADIVLEPFTAEQARIAREAYRDYGKGSGHPAGLNFGDCMAYALAKSKREALLFKGADFDKTDVQIAKA